jgi:hypothetical protein
MYSGIARGTEHAGRVGINQHFARPTVVDKKVSSMADVCDSQRADDTNTGGCHWLSGLIGHRLSSAGIAVSLLTGTNLASRRGRMRLAA